MSRWPEGKEPPDEVMKREEKKPQLTIVYTRGAGPAPAPLEAAPPNNDPWFAGFNGR